MTGGSANKTPFGMVILPSKINIPASAAHILKRPRVDEMLMQSLFCPLTTVVASAGFGKSTAIRSWVGSRPETPVAWFLLDAEDAALDRFWQYFIASIRKADAAACSDFSEVLMMNSMDSIRPVIDSLIYQLNGYGGDLVCVLGDFHKVNDAQGVNESLQYFIKHLPVNVHVVISTRRPVHFPTQKMRVEGLLAEVTEADLRFTRSEIADFFEAGGIALAHKDLDELCAATKGWPTGNKLVLLYVERSRSSVKDALARTKPIMSDYLLEEVFSNLSDDQQEFLVTTSIASAFSPSLAEHITGFPRTKVMEIVDFLKESDLFIEYVEDSDKEEWFRYQALFSETLSTRKAHMDSEKALAVKRAARDWFEEHSYLDHVVEISSDIRDYAKIKEVILAHWLFHYMTDSHATLIRWASLIPEAEIRKNPMVCAILAMPVAVAGDLEKGNAYISNAVENLREEDDFLSALCMSQKAYISTFQNDLADARACAEQALEHLPAKEYYLRGMMLQVIASSYLESEPLRAKAGFIKAIELQQPLGNKNLLCSAYSNLAAICQHLGHIKEAEHYVEMALGVYPQQESCFKPMLSFAFLAMMGCCYQRANYRKAQEAYDMFEACCQALGVLSKIAEAKALSAKVSYSLGSPAGKGEFFQALSVSETGALLSFPSLPMSKDYLAAFRAKALERAGRGSPEAFVRVFEYGLQLHLDADGICEQACAFADSIDKEERIACVYAHIIAALCCEKAMRHTASLDYMAKALLLAHEHMLIQTMLENGSYIKPLLKRLCVHEKWGGTDAARFAQEVLRQLDTKDFKLTDREIAVIRSVAEGRTVEETARELYISRNTAKKHLANIYSKLGVSSKMQAVILLKQEGII